MQRRPLDYARDIDLLVEMQYRTFEINFPGERFIERLFRDSLRRLDTGQAVYLYEEEGDLLGWLWLDFSRHHASVHIRHVEVAESHWGEGIGRAIMKDALAIAREGCCREVTLNVTKTNARALTLYEALGFDAQIDLGERQHMTLRLSGVDGAEAVSG
jgi:GNAT superfamily N-acetyltransferase